MFIFGAGYEKDTLLDVQREAAAYFDQYGTTITLPTTSRRGTKCLRLLGGQWVDYALPTTDKELFVGLAFLSEGVASTGTSTGVFARLYSSANAGFYIQAYVNAGRRLAIMSNAGGSVSWVSNTVLAAGGWYHLGLHLKQHLTTGELSADIGGLGSPDATPVTGKTSDTGWGALDTLRLWGTGVVNDGFAHRFSDVYVNDSLDTDGLGNNVLWGDYKAVGRRMSVNGTNTGLTRSAGADDAALVSDDSDATYLYGLTGRTTMVPVPIGFSPSNIKARVVKMVADKEDATARTLDLATKVGATDYDHATEAGVAVKALEATNKRRYAFLQPADPSTGVAWADAAAIDAAEIGPLLG